MSDTKNSDALVLHWPGKLFSADDLRRHWKNQRELVLYPKALITPLALDELRAKGVRITRQEKSTAGHDIDGTGISPWVYVQEQPHPVVAAAAAALERQGIRFTAYDLPGSSATAWLQVVSEWRGRKKNGVVFCVNAALVCCLTNKTAGLRAAAVCSAQQTTRALATLGANVLVVEMPGRTFFEVRQILSEAANVPAPACPPEIGKVLAELEAHAHR